MRNFFQPRLREPVARTASTSASSSAAASRPATAASAMPDAPTTRAELEDGVTVSELSELEAQALCASEGIAFFWPLRESAVRR